MNIDNIQFKSTLTDVDRYNFDTLAKRSRGQRFMVNKEGEFVEIKGIFSKIYYLFFRVKERAKVSEVVTKTLGEIDSKQSNREDLKELFFEKLKPLSERVFNRSVLSEKIIFELRDGNVADSLDISGRVEDVRFAVKLGVNFDPVSEGHNGVYYGRNYMGKRLVVFKPYDEEGTSCNSPKLNSKIKGILFRIFPSLRTHRNLKRENAYLNEIGASCVDRYLDLDLVPDTQLESFSSDRFSSEDEKKGSCQIYVEDSIMLQEKLGVPAFKRVPFFRRLLQKLWLIFFGQSQDVPYNLEDLKKFAIIEFLTGNQDGHSNNQLIHDKNIHAIDYGLAFPERPPESFFSTINQYQFSYYPDSKKLFTDEDKLLIEKLDNPNALFTKLEAEMTDHDGTAGFDCKQKAAMLERIQILKAVVDQKKSIAYLGGIKYASDFERARLDLGLPISS